MELSEEYLNEIDDQLFKLCQAHDDLRKKYLDCIAFIKRVKHKRCCLVCHTNCLACEALELLRKLKEEN